MDVDLGRALAFRLAAQHVSERAAAPDVALRGWAVQDSPPGAAAAAVVNRTGAVEPGWLDAGLHADRSLVALYNARTATAVLPGDEVAAYGTAMLPDDDAGLRAIAGSAVPERREGFEEPVALAVDAVADALDGVVRSRDDLHEELRRRLPRELLPWCAGCRSHHARRGLLVMASLHGRLCLAGRAGRQPAFARTDQWHGWDPPPRAEAGAELVRRYLSGYGAVDAGALHAVGGARHRARPRAVGARRGGARARAPRRPRRVGARGRPAAPRGPSPAERRAPDRSRRPAAARARPRGAPAGRGRAAGGVEGDRRRGPGARRRPRCRPVARAEEGPAPARHRQLARRRRAARRGTRGGRAARAAPRLRVASSSRWD